MDRSIDIGDSSESPASRSFGDVFGDLSVELNRLVRTEVQVAKEELRADAPSTGRPAVTAAATLAAAAFGLLFASLAVAVGLAEIMPLGFAFLLVGAVYGAGAAVLWQRRQNELTPDEALSFEPVDGNEY